MAARSISRLPRLAPPERGEFRNTPTRSRAPCGHLPDKLHGNIKYYIKFFLSSGVCQQAADGLFSGFVPTAAKNFLPGASATWFAVTIQTRKTAGTPAKQFGLRPDSSKSPDSNLRTPIFPRRSASRLCPPKRVGNHLGFRLANSPRTGIPLLPRTLDRHFGGFRSHDRSLARPDNMIPAAASFPIRSIEVVARQDGGEHCCFAKRRAKVKCILGRRKSRTTRRRFAFILPSLAFPRPVSVRQLCCVLHFHAHPPHRYGQDSTIWSAVPKCASRRSYRRDAGRDWPRQLR